MAQAGSPTRLTVSGRLSVRRLGAAVPYAQGMAAMRDAVAQAREAGPTLLLLEHTDTITVTRSGGHTHVRATAAELDAAGITLVETDRGGDVTFHGAGQLVGYPVFVLPRLESGLADLMGYLRTLEHGLLAATHALGVPDAYTIDGKTGIWVPGMRGGPARKLTAIGVGVKNAVTRHGFAMNITTDLPRFTDRITPCGLVGLGVTSLAALAAERGFDLPNRADIESTLLTHLADAFGLTLEQAPAAA